MNTSEEKKEAPKTEESKGSGESLAQFVQRKNDEKDMKARANRFMEEYEKLSKKYKLAFVAKLTFLGGGRDGFVPTLAVTDSKVEPKIVYNKGKKVDESKEEVDTKEESKGKKK